MGEGWGAGMSTKSMTHEAVADALAAVQRSALLSVDKTVLQAGAVQVDDGCKLQYIAQPPSKL